MLTHMATQNIPNFEYIGQHIRIRNIINTHTEQIRIIIMLKKVLVDGHFDGKIPS